jgi:hypothetical protein
MTDDPDPEGETRRGRVRHAGNVTPPGRAAASDQTPRSSADWNRRLRHRERMAERVGVFDAVFENLNECGRFPRNARNCNNLASSTGVVRADRVAKLQSTRADDQVGEGQIDSLRRLLAADARWSRPWPLSPDGRDGGLQFAQKLSAFRRIGTMDSVGQFDDVSEQMMIDTSPTAARMCWITSGVVRLARSAATRTRE